LQRHGADVGAALGRGAGAGAVSDGGLRRHGGRQLAVGQPGPDLWRRRRPGRFGGGAGSVRADRPARAPALDRQPQHGPAAPLDRTADRPGHRTAQRAGHRLHRLSYPRGGHRRLSGPDGRTAPHPPPRRRAPVAPDARPGRTADLGREIPDADLAGLHPAQPADHPRRRRRQRRHPRPASGAGQARGASPDRADHRPPGRQSARRPPLRRAADRPDPILL
ncbi:hypothetical protein LTR94_028337, partial [Friedmanniomyces endolithicus]